ncbi:MAG: sterol desaturase family protein [Pseudomonadota bacterium]
MSVHSYLMFFLPVFAAMIAAEYFIGRKRGLKLYTKDQSIASVVIAAGQRIISFVPLSLVGFIWVVIYDHRVFDMPTGAWWYIPALFLGVEFFYYWFHRLSHEIRWLWATHSVHHSIEEMNFLASYRFGWTGRISMGGLTYTPLLFLGFPPVHIVIMLAVNLMYQSWLHTNLIGKLGPLEGIVNTPSAHRVHHARNADYLDRNHGGVLMIWDRIFGTYVAERDDDPVEYGLIKPSGSTNPVRIAFHEWGNIINDLKAYRLQYWPMLLFGPPGWAPDGQGMTSAQIRAVFRKTDGRGPDLSDHPALDAGSLEAP